MFQQIIRGAALLTVALTLSLSAAAQTPARQKAPKAPRTEAKVKVSPEQRDEAQARRIAGQLALDDKTAGKFIPLYKAYRADLRKLRTDGKTRAIAPDSLLSDEAAAAAIKADFDRQQQVLDLRRNYYKKYSDVLSAKQIRRVYQLEARRPAAPRFGRKAQRPGRQQARPTCPMQTKGGNAKASCCK